MDLLKQKIGIIGGGQLGKMMILEAKKMDFAVTILDPTVDCPASSIADQHLVADFDDPQALLKLAQQTDLVTYEFEHIAVDVLKDLKEEGLIKSYGASVDTSEEMKILMENTDAQVIEIMFNILYQEPKTAFEMAEENGVGLIVKVPLDSGWLTGKYDENSEFNGVRGRWPQEVIKRRAELVDMVKDIKKEEVSMVEEALRFILAYPEISTVIPGIRNERQLEENLNAGKEAMSAARVQKYEEFYQKNFESYLKNETFMYICSRLSR